MSRRFNSKTWNAEEIDKHSTETRENEPRTFRKKQSHLATILIRSKFNYLLPLSLPRSPATNLGSAAPVAVLVSKISSSIACTTMRSFYCSGI